MRYAAYGSNLHPRRLRERVLSAEFVGTLMMPGWQLAFHKRGKDGSAKCDVVVSSGSAFVALYDLDSKGRSKLDQIEGLGYGYMEQRLSIEGFGECFCYVASDSHIHADLTPFSWYKELVLAGLEYHEAPADYLQSVKVVPARRDTEEERHLSNMKLVAEARNHT